jgi:hypothetical protein
VKGAPSQDYTCPSCRLIITAVISDHSRGRLRSDREQLESRVPWRPQQGRTELNCYVTLYKTFPGVFPFDFLYGGGLEGGAGPAGDVGDAHQEEAQESPPNSQPARRSARERRVNSRLGGYAGSSLSVCKDSNFILNPRSQWVALPTLARIIQRRRSCGGRVG